MQETACGRKCPFAVGDDCSSCPNYVESFWVNAKDNQPQLIRDCAPKRTFMMVQDLHNRLTGVQEAQEQQRNELNAFTQSLNNAVVTAVEMSKHKAISNENVKKSKVIELIEE